MNEQSNSVNPQEVMKRQMLKDSLFSQLEQTVDQRIDRYMEIDHQGIIGNHHPQYWDVGKDGTVPVYLRLL
jgi:hypothetical protein